jgi:hypothetical protein
MRLSDKMGSDLPPRLNDRAAKIQDIASAERQKKQLKK